MLCKVLLLVLSLPVVNSVTLLSEAKQWEPLMKKCLLPEYETNHYCRLLLKGDSLEVALRDIDAHMIETVVVKENTMAITNHLQNMALHLKASSQTVNTHSEVAEVYENLQALATESSDLQDIISANAATTYKSLLSIHRRISRLQIVFEETCLKRGRFPPLLDDSMIHLSGGFVHLSSIQRELADFISTHSAKVTNLGRAMDVLSKNIPAILESYNQRSSMQWAALTATGALAVVAAGATVLAVGTAVAGAAGAATAIGTVVAAGAGAGTAGTAGAAALGTAFAGSTTIGAAAVTAAGPAVAVGGAFLKLVAGSSVLASGLAGGSFLDSQFEAARNETKLAMSTVLGSFPDGVKVLKDYGGRVDAMAKSLEGVAKELEKVNSDVIGIRDLLSVNEEESLKEHINISLKRLAVYTQQIIESVINLEKEALSALNRPPERHEPTNTKPKRKMNEL